jgi:uncharacterized protein YjbJ (UPF0337 family)
MDINRVKGAIDKVAGVTKQKTGELIGNKQLQVEGIAQEFKGKVEDAWGKAKDAVHDADKKPGK